MADKIINGSLEVTGSFVNSTKQDTLVSGTNIKTINNESILGSGNLDIDTNQAFPSSWNTYTTSSYTTKQFCDVVNADSTAVVGKSYLGEVRFSDLPSTLVNAEIIVEIMQGTGTSNKVIHLILSSGNLAPYKWEYTYWNNGSNVSGWIGFQNEITSTNKLSSDLVDDTNHTNKFVTTTDISNWNAKLDNVTASDIISTGVSAGQVLTADGDGGASWVSPDKPIHFIKLTSSTLTEALRAEILSDDYFVILEYNNKYYYEKDKSVSDNVITQKQFEMPMGSSHSGTNGYNGKVRIEYQLMIVYSSTLSIYTTTNYDDTINAEAGYKNVNAGIINSKIGTSTNATAGQVLTADGSGNTSWQNASSTTFVDWS